MQEDWAMNINVFRWTDLILRHDCDDDDY
jgi:hypothetical protein